MKWFREIVKSLTSDIREVEDKYIEDPIGEAATLLELDRQQLVYKLANEPMTEVEMLQELNINPALHGFLKRVEMTDLRSACCNVVGIDDEVFLEYTKWVGMSDEDKLSTLIRRPDSLVKMLGFIYNHYNTNVSEDDFKNPKEKLKTAKLLLSDLAVRDFSKWSQKQHLQLVGDIINLLIQYVIIYYSMHSNEQDNVSRSGGDRRPRK